MNYTPVDQFPFYWCRFNAPMDQFGETISCQMGDGTLFYRLKLVRLKAQMELVLQSRQGNYRFTFKPGWGGFTWQIKKGSRSIAKDRFRFNPWLGFHKELNYYAKKQKNWNKELAWYNQPMDDIIVFRARTQKVKSHRYFEFYFNHTGISTTDLDCLVGLSYLIFSAANEMEG